MYTISINLRSEVYRNMNTSDLLKLLEFLDSQGFNYRIIENSQNNIRNYIKE